eukprot:snap_masked-scaffold_14-processed-gene-0.8-mRNA-1 protein AED:0.20 eAED:0.60 QI:0/-1/0/1/-1/1/1/0/179
MDFSSKRQRDKQGTGINEKLSSGPEKFGKNFLKKFGWKEGDGLGKNRQGNSEHIKVQKRDDNVGLGSSGKEKSNGLDQTAWWDDVFANAAAQIKKTQTELSSATSESISEDEDKKSKKKKKKKDKKRKKRKRKAESELVEDTAGMSEKDREIFLACGGRRLGRRAYSSQTAKLKRVKNL